MLTREEALDILDNAEVSDEPCKLNPINTHREFHRLIRNWAFKKPPGYIVKGLFERRVYQAARNQKRPRY